MDQRERQAMLTMDDRHWWYRGRRRVIRAELDKLSLAPGARVLDAGCGSGRTLEELVDYGETYGIEFDPDAAALARSRGVGDVRVGRVEELPWDGDFFDLITCLDVIEHTPDDRRSLRELRRVCKPSGHLLITVPAYQALWSLHDVANHHYRRYARRTLRAAAIEAGWRVDRMTSFNSLLLAPAAEANWIARGRTLPTGLSLLALLENPRRGP
jgi:SAM-dependent methyltransferase